MYKMFKDKLQIDPLTNLNKYLHSDTCETEVDINISVNISVNNGSKTF